MSSRHSLGQTAWAFLQSSNIFLKLLWFFEDCVALQWLQSPLALVSAPHHDPWIYICLVCLCISWPDPLPAWLFFSCPKLSLGHCGLGFLKAGLASKVWREEDIQDLSLSHVTGPPPQILLSFPFVTYVPIEALFAAFDIPVVMKYHLGIGFLTASQHAWLMSLYSSQVTCPCFHPL